MEFDFKNREAYWTKYWQDNGTYKAEIDQSKPKYYVLDMFPYPSGAGLHVGHPLGYIASDIFSRYKRHKGFNVLHPMGFDSFGLPAEQYAIETGQHPEVTTSKAIENYKRQFNLMGLSFDWSRELYTSDPQYYKWTQWLFLEIFNSWYNVETNRAEKLDTLIAKFESGGCAAAKAHRHECEEFSPETWRSYSDDKKSEILMNYRLAYLKDSQVWWCEELGTVLANDEVKDGFSERGGFPVEKKKLRQWSLRITAYAERLLDGLNKVEWSDSLREMQKNWIGKSKGASVFFELDAHDKSIEIYTTRPDTIFGATFMVLAPEHDLVKEICTDAQKADVEEYIAYVKKRSERDRMSEVKVVTGANTGAHVIHPFTKEKIPVWISEYVLASYGTGSIMAVPSDDDRDFSFAEKFGLKVIDVVDKTDYPGATKADKIGKIVNSDFLNGMEVPEAITEMNNRIESMGIGKAKTQYRLHDAGFSRQRYWGEPFPINYPSGDEAGRPEALAFDQLPVELPKMTDFKGSGKNGKGPLSRVEQWMKMPEGAIRESDTMPGYAGSSWYFLRFMDPNNSDRFVSQEAIDYWQDVDFYIGGAEHAVGHLMYSRMWHKFLKDMGLVKTEEPFKRLVNQGMIQGRSNFVYRDKKSKKFISKGLIKDESDVSVINVDIRLAPDDILDTEAFKKWRPDLADAEFELEDGKYVTGVEIQKMSKSKYNTHNPDDVIAQYGADAFRMFEMFLGPIEQHKPWDTKGIDGVAKFIKKYWRLFVREDKIVVSDDKPTAAELKILHNAINKVSQDVERLSFNTATSAFMVCVNELTSLKCNKREILEPLTILLAPFAPFVTEELWMHMGHKDTVHLQPYPEYDASHTKESAKEYPISINGKVRAKITLPLGLSKEEVEPKVLELEAVTKWTEGKEIRKFIFVPGKIVNIVV